uniref:YqgF/RNase H-like domain-containing protein n=1 Tax=Rhizophora mucronata TaxID=61149 RepID=A0A2P2JR72_RHIMU
MKNTKMSWLESPFFGSAVRAHSPATSGTMIGVRNTHPYRSLWLDGTRKYGTIVRAVLSVKEIPPNAFRRNKNPRWRGGGFSLGVDLGLSRTGLALSKGFSVRPLTVLELRGQKLELRLLDIAQHQEADEFIIGLPTSWDGKETPQANKVRSIAGRLAVRAAERGWRVYLQDEHGTTNEATYSMIDMGLSKTTRQKSTDAYAAVFLSADGIGEVLFHGRGGN